MQRTSLLLYSIPVLGLAACTPKPQTETLQYPKMTLGQATLDFGATTSGNTVTRTVLLSNDGDMPMGIGATEDGYTGIDIGPGMDGTTPNTDSNYKVTYSTADISCPTDAATSPDRRKHHGALDGDTGGSSGGGGSGGVDTGSSGGKDTGGGGGTEPLEGAIFLLDPGCSIPLTVTFTPTDSGEVWGSLVVESSQAALTQDQSDNNELPDFLRDPIHYRQQVYLHGTSTHTEPTVTVSPRSWDYGFVYPGSVTDNAMIAVKNVGTADLTLTSIALSESCDTTFAITSAPADGSILPAGEATLVEVAFDPNDTSAAYCQLDINSDDSSSPAIEITLKGNSGTDPNNHRPTVAIRSPENGYVYPGNSDLTLELNVFDQDQPANTLTCKVKSMLQDSSIATCTPEDESGHTYVSIPADDLDDGVDTLTVTVTDGSQSTADASVSVLISANFPADDDDGDGFSPTDEEYVDCDDDNRNTYPDAAEIYDGADNDCDGEIDEGTDGYDDDGDDFSEVDGDCNDDDDQTYPGAPERSDGVDNDCDGTIDEGTSLFDDDGDGFAEVNNDCNDDDPNIHPGAVELCDGVDNDCDNLYDSADGCVSADSEPVVVGIVNATQNACEGGDKIGVSVLVYDADGQTTTYAWQSSASDGIAGFDNASAQSANWTCPTDVSSGGQAVHVYVVVTDPDAHQNWSDSTIAVYPSGYGLYDDYTHLLDSGTTTN